ncbi:MAG: sugar nucleotide-binding protein [Enterocloster bolteae]
MNNSIYLVGNTGFVGSNLMQCEDFTMSAHSLDVTKMYGHRPDVLVYAGVTGTKWLANQNPAQDMKVIEQTIINIVKIKPKKIVLISTVDVYDELVGSNEDSTINEECLHTYGRNRYHLEKWVRGNCEDYHIVRIPALYGLNIKKNFVFDLINLIPAMMKEEQFNHVEKHISCIANFYSRNNEGIYVLNSEINRSELIRLRKEFAVIEENALIFTNSNSKYQFYNLQWLWTDILNTINQNISVRNIVTEPVNAGEVYEYINGHKWCNENPKIINYNIQTLYGKKYLIDKSKVLEDLKRFCMNQIFIKYGE